MPVPAKQPNAGSIPALASYGKSTREARASVATRTELPEFGDRALGFPPVMLVRC